MIKKFFSKYCKIVNYIIVGVLTTVVSLAVYYFCVFTFLNPQVSWELQLANIISWLVAVSFAYFANRKYVFKSKNINIMAEAAAFLSSRLGTLLMDMAIMFVTVTLCGMNDKIAKLIVQVVVTIGNYILSKFFVFK